MGKRRVTAKAPRTPLNLRSRSEQEELSTPGRELAKRGFCKEDFFMSSQPNSQIDVKWDCYSPDALHQVTNKNRRQFNEDDISDLVLKLADESGDICHTTEPLPGLWTASYDDQVETLTTNAPRRSSRNRRSRKPFGRKPSLNPGDLLNKFAEAVNRQLDSNEEDLESSVARIQESPKSDAADRLTVIEEESLSASRLRLKGDNPVDLSEETDRVLRNECESNKESQEDEQWSDEDLFANTSLLLDATSILCSPTPRQSSRLSKRKSLMQSPSEPQIKSKRLAQSGQNNISPANSSTSNLGQAKSHLPLKLDEKVDKPPNLRSNGLSLNKNGYKSLPQSTDNCSQLKTANNIKPYTCAVSSSVTTTTNEISTLQNKPILCTNSKPSLVYKEQSKWNSKTTANSVSMVLENSDIIPNSQRPCVNSGLNSTRTFKRHNTYPSVVPSPKRMAPSTTRLNGVKNNFVNQNKSNNNNRQPVVCNQLYEQSTKSTTAPVKSLKKSDVFSPNNRSRRRSSIDSSLIFNTSLSDDLLCQLAEPDEILDSQMCSTAMQAVGTNILKKFPVPQPASNSVKNIPVAQKQAVHSKSELKPIRNGSNGLKITPKTGRHLSAGSDKATNLPNINNNNPNDSNISSAPCCNQYSVSQKLNQSNKYQFKSLRSKDTIPNPAPAPTAIPQAGKSNVNPQTGSGKSELDDSFLTDDELSNPQVLAMIEEVEIQATQSKPAPKSPVFKCTPDEIEKKKRAALERRQKNLKLQKKKPVLSRPTARHYNPLF